MKLRLISFLVSVLVLSGTSGLSDIHPRQHAKEDAVSGGHGTNSWSVHLLQSAHAPHLRMEETKAREIKISWPSSPHYELKVNTNNVHVTWTSPAEKTQADGTNAFVVVVPPAGISYYKLEAKE